MLQCLPSLLRLLSLQRSIHRGISGGDPSTSVGVSELTHWALGGSFSKGHRTAQVESGFPDTHHRTLGGARSQRRHPEFNRPRGELRWEPAYQAVISCSSPAARTFPIACSARWWWR